METNYASLSINQIQNLKENDFLRIGISFGLTIMNILCIYIFAAITFKIKKLN